MAATTVSKPGEYPQAADLREMIGKLPLPVVAQDTVNPDLMTDEESTKEASAVLNRLNAALAADNAEAIASCFSTSQAYWKDQLALTWHLRTFTTPSTIAASLLETRKLRGADQELKLDGDAHFITVNPVLQFIACNLLFSTNSPKAACCGRLLLIPVRNNETVEWKIWILSTWLDQLDVQPEDETLLQSPSKQPSNIDNFETDVFIIGGGNAALTLAARLKALGVDSVMAERNAHPGDNWALRYDSMRFHVTTSSSEMPYMHFGPEYWGSHRLGRDELIEHIRRYVDTFKLNMITSAKILSSVYHQSAKQWVIRFQTPAGEHVARSKHLVQATGFGAQKPFLPQMADTSLYRGISVHSAHYKNATELKARGAKSALVIGSASTAFDVLQDCHAAGLETTMVIRSRTFIVPVEHVFDKHGFGAYDTGVEQNDRIFMTVPTWVDSQLARGLLAQLLLQEPGRYAALAATGFPFIDSTHPDGVLAHYLIERAGGHYVDVGGTKLISEGKVAIKVGVAPIGYTETGLRFSDGTTIDADAIVWCTGFADHNARNTAAEILGGDSDNGEKDPNVLGPREVADRLDATWGVDAEGEIRGMWKRHLRVDNYWTMGGHTQHQRWYSRLVALQIKAELEGILPPAYRETPEPRNI